MRYAVKRDANEREIVQALRSVGAAVWLQHTPFDLLVGYKGRFVTLEVKDGAKPASARALTEAEDEFLDLCRYMSLPHYVVTSPEQALAAVGARRDA